MNTTNQQFLTGFIALYNRTNARTVYTKAQTPFETEDDAWGSAEVGEEVVKVMDISKES